MEHHKAEAIALLDTWRRSATIRDLGLHPSLRIDVPRDSKEIREIFYFYKVLRFFIDDFQKNVPRPSWIQPNQWQDEIIPLELSGLEEGRILRALCRLQVVSNIFAMPEIENDSGTYPDNHWTWHGNGWEPHHEGYRLFYRAMPPWEYEGNGSLWGYLASKYVPILKEVCEYLRNLANAHRHFKQPRNGPVVFFLLPPDIAPPLGRLVFECEWDIDLVEWKIDGLAGMGPEFLYRVIHANHLERRNLVMRNAPSGAGCNDSENTFIGANIEIWNDEDWLPWTEPANRHAIRKYEKFWSTLPPIEQPNLAWKKSKII
ncbi:hypothetical protein N7488_002642 [Penicillium malachiteum]|nr:hypothetical protein N7488_002642 [Penicillium malachiteum]